MFVFREIKISPKEKEKKILSLHDLRGLQSAESAFRGDRKIKMASCIVVFF